MGTNEDKKQTEYEKAPEPLFETKESDIEEPDVPSDESSIAQEGPSGQQSGNTLTWINPTIGGHNVRSSLPRRYVSSITTRISGRFSQPTTGIALTIFDGSYTPSIISLSNLTVNANNQDFSLDVTFLQPTGTLANRTAGIGIVYHDRISPRITNTSTATLLLAYSSLPYVDWTVSAPPNPADPANYQEPFTLSGQWSTAVSGFTASDINIFAGPPGNSQTYAPTNFVLNANNRDFSFTVTPPPIQSGFGIITIEIPGNRITGGNDGQVQYFTYTRLGPPYVIWTIPTGTQTTAFTVRGLWSRALTRSSFTSSDITVSSGTVNDFSFDADNRNFSFTLTPPATGQGTITITIAQNAVTPNNCEQTRSITYDSRPRVRAIIGEGVQQPTGRSIRWPVTLSSSSLRGLDADDIISRVPSGATVSVTGAGTSYRVGFTGFSSGDTGNASFSIRANAFTSASLPSNTLNNVETAAPAAAYDFRPRVTITIGTGTVNTANRTISWLLTFSAANLAGFNLSDIINKTPSTARAALSGTGTTRTLTFSGFSAGDSGNADFSIRANAFLDSSLPSNTLNNVQTETTAVNYNFVDTTNRVSITIGPGVIDRTARTIAWPLTLSHSGLTGLDAVDVTSRLPGTAAVALTGSGTSYTVTFGPFAVDDTGIADFSIRAGAFDAASLPATYRNNVQVNATGVGYNFGTQVLTDVSHIPNGPTTTTWRVEFNQELDANTFTLANAATDWQIIADSPVVTTASNVTITGVRRSATDLKVWYVDTTYPEHNYGGTYFRIRNNAASLGLCEYQSDTYEWGLLNPVSVVDLDWPNPIPGEAGDFFMDVDFNQRITGLNTGALILDGPASVSFKTDSPVRGDAAEPDTGTQSIMAEPNRALRTARDVTTPVADDGPGARYWRIYMTKTADYNGETVTLAIRSGTVRGEV